MANVNIQRVDPETHELVAEINHAAEDMEITWLQRQTLVQIAVGKPEEARELLRAWRREPEAA